MPISSICNKIRIISICVLFFVPSQGTCLHNEFKLDIKNVLDQHMAVFYYALIMLSLVKIVT